MARGSKSIDPRQSSLFELLREASSAPERALIDGELDDDRAVRAILNSDLKDCPLSRWQVAGELSHHLNHEVTKYTIDSWTADSKEGHRFPFAYARAWCAATGSQRLAKHLGEKLGLFLVPGPEALRAEIQHDRENLRERQRALRQKEAFVKVLEEKR